MTDVCGSSIHLSNEIKQNSLPVNTGRGRTDSSSSLLALWQDEGNPGTPFTTFREGDLYGVEDSFWPEVCVRKSSKAGRGAGRWDFPSHLPTLSCVHSRRQENGSWNSASHFHTAKGKPLPREGGGKHRLPSGSGTQSPSPSPLGVTVPTPPHHSSGLPGSAFTRLQGLLPVPL